jgi:hypothetical protein
MNITVNATVEGLATPALNAKLAKIDPDHLAAKIRGPLEEFWRDRLKSLGTNKRGWPSTKFYERAARSVVAQRTEGGVMLIANQLGLRQRWKGGTISPVHAKALTIPISPVSYGKVPKDFPDLFLLKTLKGAYLVQHGEQVSEKTGRTIGLKNGGGNSARRLRGALNFLFKLVGSVEQEGDDRVVPTNAEFSEVAKTAILESIA